MTSAAICHKKDLVRGGGCAEMKEGKKKTAGPNIWNFVDVVSQIEILEVSIDCFLFQFIRGSAVRSSWSRNRRKLLFELELLSIGGAVD